MATNDTDPQRTQPFADDASRTEPGAVPVANDASPDASSDAASLLASLAETSQPLQDVPETEGHIAAAYAAAPHRPPRPNDKTVENPAVFVNATVPLLDPPPSSSRQKLGPPAAPFVSMNGAPTVPGGARLFEDLQRNETTEPGERAKNQMRIYLACIAGVVVAGLIAVGILTLVQSKSPSTSTSTSSAVPSASAAPPITPPQPVVTVAPTGTTTATATTTATTAAAAPSPAPTVTTKPTTPVRPHGSSTSPRPSGTFAEPDRNL